MERSKDGHFNSSRQPSRRPADLWGLRQEGTPGCHLSPQQHLQLCLPRPLQLQLLLNDPLHPGHVGPGLLPPGLVHTLVLVLLL